MRSVLLIPGIFYVLKSSIILSLAYTHRPTVGKIIAFNLCTQNHCEDCSGGEVLKCSNGAIFDRHGDLCGCCQSCVRFQDIGESCGSQLAVRSSENFRVSRPRVVILAATRCKKNLICQNFICKRIDEPVDREKINEETFELRSELTTTTNPTELYNEPSPLIPGSPDVEYHANDFTKQASKQSREASLPIASSKKTTIEAYENEMSSRETELDMESGKDTIFDPSGHLINLSVGARELQLIYGREALADFNILIESIDKSVTNSMLKKRETAELYERFKEVVQFVGAIKEPPHPKKDISSWTSYEIEISFANKNPNLSKTAGDAAAIAVQPNFIPRAHFRDVLNSGTSSSKIRTKREPENDKKIADAKVEDHSQENQKKINERNQYPEISVYDVINKTPKQKEDFEQWLSTRTMERNHDDEFLDSDETESEINIHITGLPGASNQSLEVVQLGGKNNEDIRIDSEFDVKDVRDDANSDVVEISEDQTENSTNLVASNVLQDQENHDITEGLDEKLQFSNNTYEFTFPEYPVILDNKRDAGDAANETTDEIRAQLDRIETKAIVIETAVHDILNKIDRNRRYEEGERETADPNDGFDVGDDEMNRESNSANPRNENAINLRASSNGPRHKNVTVKNTRLNEFHQKRPSRQWRTQLNGRSELSWDVPKISRIRRRRPHRNEERHQTERYWESSDERRQKYLPTRQKDSMEDSRKGLERRKLPILVSNRHWKGSNLYDRHKASRLVSNTPQERTSRPFDFSRALPMGRTNGRIKQGIRASGRPRQTDNPDAEESIIFLETQIPRSTKLTDASSIADPTGARSTRLVTKYDDDDNWNLRATTYLSNLFAAQEGNSEFGSPPGPALPEALISSMEPSGTNEVHRESGDADDNYWLLPGDLDYVERTEPKDDKVETVESDSVQSSPNINQREPTSSSLDRTKRDASATFLPKPKLNLKRRSFHRTKTLVPKGEDGSSIAKNTSLDLESSKTVASTPNVPQNGPMDVKNPPGRSRRSVQMVDWLRAAQEYHERLRGLRAAALKTWLASREIITDANMTNVKLFTRETPPHLQTHEAESFEEKFDDIPDEGIEDYPADFREAEDATADSSEILTGIFVDRSSPRDLDSDSEEIQANERDEQRLIQVSSSSGPRKLTITTNGNSTIRIEDVADVDDDAGRLADQMTQDSTADEVSHEIPITASDTDYFDHMYESFDTDDGDFNYEDSGSMSGWIDEFVTIDPSDRKHPRKDRPRESSVEKARRSSPGRYKRNSPLVLFRTNGDRKKDVLVWPSNWRDLIHRHLRLNRSGSNPPETTKRRAYLGPRKIFSMPVSSKFETGAKIDQRKN